MDFFSISISTVILRFFLMMGVIIIGLFSGQFWLTALGLPIFLSVMLGIGLKPQKAQAIAVQSNKTRSRVAA